MSRRRSLRSEPPCRAPDSAPLTSRWCAPRGLERKGAATNFLRPLASRASRRPPDRDALRARKALSLTVRGAVAGCEARLRRGGGLSVLAAFSPDC